MPTDPTPTTKDVANTDTLCAEDAAALEHCKRAGVPDTEFWISSTGRLVISGEGSLKLALYAESAKRPPKPVKPKIIRKKVGRRTIRSVSDGSSY